MKMYLETPYRFALDVVFKLDHFFGMSLLDSEGVSR